MRTRRTLLVITIVSTFCLSSLFAGNEKNYTYLALGDSIAFGMDPTKIVPGQLPNAASFSGYPEVVAAVEHLLQSKKEANAACPGETSGSFIYGASNPFGDAGCYHDFLGFPAFKPIGLHTAYTGTQLDFATSEFDNNKHINLVTLGIGSNDILLSLVASCPDGSPTCFRDANVDFAASIVSFNLNAILDAIRAHYSGTLILMNYYSPNAAFDRAVATLNGTIAAAAAAHPGVKLADAFGAFQAASANSGNGACGAGLLIQLNPGPTPLVCDIHPSPLGQALLAATVEAVR